ncbi:MAG: hypothetical protein PHQ96_06850 [Candidatus Omnitrophica bacterium]|nr:hypothetical protein [Candidatus Omnitrophota bacterium]
METSREKILKESELSKNYQAARNILKNKEKLLNAVMDSMGDGLSIQDLDMRIIYQNKFMVDNFGAHIGEYCYNIYERRDKICEGCPVVKAYRSGETNMALRIGITKDGASFRFENIASVLRDEQGKIVAGMELCRIVEKREAVFDDLKKKKNELESFNKLMVDRELKMIELKKRIENLEKRLEQKP